MTPQAGEVTARRVMSFRGASARRATATWSQLWTWDIIQEITPNEQRIDFRIKIRVSVPRSVDDVVAAVARATVRYETLRTTFELSPNGQLEQIVHGSGSVEVAQRDCGARAPVEVAEEMKAELGARRFDLSRDLPVRLGVVTDDGRPCFLVLVISNMALDGWSLDLVFKELTRLIENPDADEPDDVWQPVDQAWYESSDRGRRVADTALAYWKEQLAAAAETREPRWRPAGEVPRFWYGRFSSHALAQAAHTLAARLRVPTSAVLLAGVTALVTQLKGQPACDLLLVVSNRYQARVRRAVGKLFQSTPVHLDVAHPTFDELVVEASGRMLTASRCGRSDPMQVSRLVHSTGPRRGAHLALPVIFDYHHQEASGPPRDVTFLRRAALSSSFDWLDAIDEENMHLYVQVHRFDEQARIAFWIDTRFLSRADLAALVFGLERLLIEAVAGDVLLGELSAVTGVAGRGAPTGGQR